MYSASKSATEEDDPNLGMIPETYEDSEEGEVREEDQA
jgi:hypothetical protein